MSESTLKELVASAIEPIKSRWHSTLTKAFEAVRNDTLVDIAMDIAVAGPRPLLITLDKRAFLLPRDEKEISPSVDFIKANPGFKNFCLKVKYSGFKPPRVIVEKSTNDSITLEMDLVKK